MHTSDRGRKTARFADPNGRAMAEGAAEQARGRGEDVSTLTERRLALLGAGKLSEAAATFGDAGGDDPKGPHGTALYSLRHAIEKKPPDARLWRNFGRLAWLLNRRVLA
ncbi:MAG: hypothetical protein ACREGL_02740, partial [Alphaproteobacteria bacterium]